MDITSLDIKNFLTISDASVELDNRGLLLIQGVNKDDPSAESNGAGKSSIVDGLCWAIYGVTARGVTGDSVVNKKEKKDCCVSVELIDGAVPYQIARYRKDSTHKNQVFLTSGTTNLSKGTDKETQEVINQIMGCSLEVFMAAVYAGQEAMPDLPGMTDKVLKTLIEEAAGVEELTAAYAVARNRLVSVKARFDATMTMSSTTAAQLGGAGAELSSMELERDKFEIGRKDRAKLELARVIPIKSEIAELTASVASESESDLKAKVESLDERLAGGKGENDFLAGLVMTQSRANMKKNALETSIANGKKNIEAMERGLASVSSRVGSPCGECGKEYRVEDLTEATERQKISIAKAKEELLPVIASLKEATDAQKAASDAADEFRASMTDLSSVVASQRVLSGRINEIKLVRSSIERKQKEIEGIGAIAKTKLSEANPWTKAVESKVAQIAKLEADFDSTKEVVSALTGEVEMLNDAVKVYGPAGVRAHILDTVTPFLNERTSEYLGALSDGNIHAVWATLSKTAKGELREKFNIEVTNDLGAESFAGLSGGEKRKVRLASAMALQDMVASRATKPIGLFIADEVDHALDEAGLERLMGVLERKARERGTVLVISHNSLSDWCSNIITVTKSGGVATVDGSTTHGF